MSMDIVGIEWVGAAFGVLGTVLLALRGPRAGLGFVAYLVSNVCWLTASWTQGQWPLFGQQLAFLASSLLGIWLWILRPAIEAADKLFDL